MATNQEGSGEGGSAELGTQDVGKIEQEHTEKNWLGWAGDLDATFSDVTICFGNRHFYAHKVILASRSEYFKSMFTNAFKESNQRTITLEDDDPEALGIMLNWMYVVDALPKLRQGEDGNREAIQELYMLADKYRVLGLAGAAMREILKTFSSKWDRYQVAQVLEFITKIDPATLKTYHDDIVKSIEGELLISIFNRDEYDDLLEQHPGLVKPINLALYNAGHEFGRGRFCARCSHHFKFNEEAGDSEYCPLCDRHASPCITKGGTVHQFHSQTKASLMVLVVASAQSNNPPRREYYLGDKVVVRATHLSLSVASHRIPIPETSNMDSSDEDSEEGWTRWCGNLSGLLEDPVLSDMSLLIDGRVYKVHKVILAARSDYFKTLFTGRFAESHHNKIAIKDDDPAAMDTMITYFYDRKALQHISAMRSCSQRARRIFDIFIVADKYRVAGLASTAIDLLLKDIPTRGPWDKTRAIIILKILTEFTDEQLSPYLGRVETALTGDKFRNLFELQEYDDLLEQHSRLQRVMKRHILQLGKRFGEAMRCPNCEYVWAPAMFSEIDWQQIKRCRSCFNFDYFDPWQE
ncbi:hypothetical protein KVT40_004253 [Elsinoe batatas]|uniref:BTB domain-containing protein n=1 Tax=Elsinoe batatas TaxID=2601811 RepID=A0A8K0PDS1_9PEZI|nr:hypothetical protein KVT40_004253 [Elsinoe batatas]